MTTASIKPATPDTSNAPIGGPRIYTAEDKANQEIQDFESIRRAHNTVFSCRNKFCMYSGHVASHLDDVVHVAEDYMDDFCSVSVEFQLGRWIVWADQHSHDGCDNTSERLFSFAQEVRIAERVARELNAYVEVEQNA